MSLHFIDMSLIFHQMGGCTNAFNGSLSGLFVPSFFFSNQAHFNISNSHWHNHENGENLFMFHHPTLQFLKLVMLFLMLGCSWWRKNCIEGSLFWIGRKSCWCLTVRTDMPFLIFVDSLPAHCFFASSLFQCGLSVMLVIQFCMLLTWSSVSLQV